MFHIHVTWNMFVDGLYGALNGTYGMCLQPRTVSAYANSHLIVDIGLGWLHGLGNSCPLAEPWDGAGATPPLQWCDWYLTNFRSHPRCHVSCHGCLTCQDVWFLGWRIKFFRSQSPHCVNVCQGPWSSLHLLLKNKVDASLLTWE